MNKYIGLFAVLGTLLASSASAYVGPGAGISLLGSVATTMLVILLAIGAILFWPVRYLWRRMRGKSKQSSSGQDSVVSREAE